MTFREAAQGGAVRHEYDVYNPPHSSGDSARKCAPVFGRYPVGDPAEARDRDTKNVILPSSPLVRRHRGIEFDMRLYPHHGLATG